MKNKRLSVKDYAKLYNTNRMRVYRLIKKGKLETETNKYGVKMVLDNKWNKGVINI